MPTNKEILENNLSRIREIREELDVIGRNMAEVGLIKASRAIDNAYIELNISRMEMERWEVEGGH